jgi:hypothetical protein
MLAGQKVVPYNLISGFDKGIVPKIGTQRALNVYVIYPNDPEDFPALYDLPGIKGVTTIGSDPNAVCRNLIKVGDYLYAVYGQNIYRLDNNLFPIQLGGSLSTDQGVVRSSQNENQIIWVDGVDGYVWNFITEIATFPIPRTGASQPFPFQPLDITNLDGYGIVVQGESNNWLWSALNDFLVWTIDQGGGAAKIVSQPTTCSAISTINRKLFIFGTTICEPWYDDPVNDNQPFQRNNNLIFEFGTQARGSVIQNYSRLVWLASTKNGFDSVKMSDGGFPISISSPEIEYVFREYEEQYGISDAIAMLYKENGHIFYEIAFPTANHSWVCDLSAPNPTEAWFERQMNNGNRFIGQFYAEFNGKHYVGSAVDNRLFELSSDYGTYDDEVFLRRIIGSTFQSEALKKIAIYRWEFDLLMGTGSPDGLNADPLFYLSISDDAGVTFGNRITANVGEIGHRNWSLFFNRLGTQRMFTPMIEFYNNVPTAMLRSVITMRETQAS